MRPRLYFAPGAGFIGLRIFFEGFCFYAAAAGLPSLAVGSAMVVSEWGTQGRTNFAVIVFADGVGDVVLRKGNGGPNPRASNSRRRLFEELAAGAVGIADFPDLFAETTGSPFELAEVDVLAGFHGDVGVGKFSSRDAGGEGVEDVIAGGGRW